MYPTLNAVAPRKDASSIFWEGVFTQKAFPTRCSDTARYVNDILQSKGLKHSMDELFHCLSTCRPFVHDKLYQRLFRVVSKRFHDTSLARLPRRITIRVPPLSREIQHRTRTLVKGRIIQSSAPAPLKQWYTTAINVVPLRLPKVQGALSTRPRLRFTAQCVSALQKIVSPGQYTAYVLPGTYTVSALSERQTTKLRQLLLHCLHTRRCKCARLMRQHPCLRNTLGHILVRRPEQWAALTQTDTSCVLSLHAHTALLPTARDTQVALNSFILSLQSITVLGLHSMDPSTVGMPGSFSSAEITDIVNEVMSLMHLDTVGDSPTSESAKAMGADLRKQGYGMRIWDHHSHTPALYCNYLSEQRFISDILTGDRFTVWGWADTPQRASLACAYEVFQRAFDCGLDPEILHLGLQTRIPKTMDQVLPYLHTSMQLRISDGDPNDSDSEADSASASQVSYSLPAGLNLSAGRPIRAPTLSSIPKWKSSEHLVTGPFMKWRDILNFSTAPLKRTAQIVSRCLQLLLVKVIDIVPNMCLPTSLGVRDMVTTVKRLSSTNTVLAWERDMEDMFWKIDKQEVETAVSQLGRALLKHRRSTTLFYAIHRQEKSFDRVGTGTGREYWTIPHTFVEKFVKWDLHKNVLFVVDCLFLSQGQGGVPIGGPLSAQLADLWCVWREMVCLGKEGLQDFQISVVQGLQAAGVQPMPTVTMPHEDLFMPLSAVHNMLPSSHMWAAPRSQRVGTPIRAVLSNGLESWWQPLQWVVAWLSFPGAEIPLLRMSLWDGAIGGRLHTIARHAVRCDRHSITIFFMSFDAVQAVLPDIVQPRSPAVAPFPYVLMARLKDNVYILCVDIPDRYVPSVRRLLEVFLDCLYCIPLKWEPEGPVVAWCCSHILCGPHRGIGLLRKGVTWDLMAKGPEQVEWSKWLPKTALNARMVV